MEQFKLTPAGVQQWNKRVIAAGPDRVAYCSTLAIYVVELSTWRITKLIAGHERTITTLTWNPHNSNQLVTTSLDSRVVVWDIERESKMFVAATASSPVALDWSPHSEHLVVLALTNGSVMLWDLSKSVANGGPGGKEQFPELHQRSGCKASVVRWNPSDSQCVVSGHTDGSVLLADVSSRSGPTVLKPPVPEKRGSEKSKSGWEIADLQWDPLSSTYLLVAHVNGAIVLWDTDSAQLMQTFDRKGADIQALAWQSWAPGNFISVGRRSGIAKVWNVSQKRPVGMVPIAGSGFKNLLFVSTGVAVGAASAQRRRLVSPRLEQRNRQRALFSLVDGAVGVFDMGRRQLEFITHPSHKETVFDLRFSPHSEDLMATCSYDSTVKIWHTPTMRCAGTLSGQEGVIYGVSWGPPPPLGGTPASGDDKHASLRIASCSSKGTLYVWSVSNARALVRAQPHTGAVYRVDWNRLSPRRIATSGHDGVVVVTDSNTGKGLCKLPHGTPVFGCMWHPTKATVLATGGMDSHVRVWDTGSPGAPLRTLRGHTARVFNTVWSGLLPNVLASGSDDTSASSSLNQH